MSHLDRLRRILLRVSTPGQYLGGEVGQTVKEPSEVRVRWALLFPDTYAVGMSHLGFKILYGLLNETEGVAAERAFAPWPDMEAEMRAAGLPLLTLETHRPVRDCDLLGFSLQYELCYTNVLAMLDLAGVPLLALDRTDADPLVVGGGVNAFQPEPVADFFDLFLLGDGEESVTAISSIVKEGKRAGAGRREVLLELARRVAGVYVPSLYGVRRADGRIAEVVPLEDGVPERVGPAHVSSLEDAYFPTRPPVPYVKVLHDRISIEVMRGCTQGCRFCQAGMLKRPNRMRSAEKVLELARQSYAATGHDEISLLSLSTADYPLLREATELLDREFRDRRVGLNVPSLRVSETLKTIPRLVDGVRRSTLTIAPEVATDRLREVIDKKIRNEDLFAGVAEAYRRGWRAVKLYFMIGLPTEDDVDVDAIVEMGRRCSELGREAASRAGDVTLSVSNFVPKPHTPFQWEPMAREDELRAKRERLYGAIRRSRKLRLKVHDVDQSLAEGILARGDRHLSRLLLRLFREGQRFDAWSEHFDAERWRRCLAEEGVDPDAVLGARDEAEILPWDHLGAPVSREFLATEWRRSRARETTPNCMDGKCAHCGVDVKDCAASIRIYRDSRKEDDSSA